MIWYHLIFSDNRKAIGYAWNLMGFVAKLAQGVCCSALMFLMSSSISASSAFVCSFLFPGDLLVNTHLRRSGRSSAQGYPRGARKASLCILGIAKHGLSDGACTSRMIAEIVIKSIFPVSITWTTAIDSSGSRGYQTSDMRWTGIISS
jgi:hypothetical protein